MPSSRLTNTGIAIAASTITAPRSPRARLLVSAVCPRLMNMLTPSRVYGDSSSSAGVLRSVRLLLPQSDGCVHGPLERACRQNGVLRDSERPSHSRSGHDVRTYVRG